MRPAQFDVTVDVLIPRPMTDRLDCATALRTLCACETLVPEFFDVVEPIREPFDRYRIDAVLDTVWTWQKGPETFMWRRRKPKSWGGIYMSRKTDPAHGAISLESTAGTAELNFDLVRFLKLAATSLGADFGLIDTPAIKPDGTRSLLALTTRDLRSGLPDLYWGTVLGKPYVELFGAQRLARAPVARREELTPGVFYLQLTDDLDDIRTQPKLVEQARAEAKQFLGLDAFRMDASEQQCGRVPQFNISRPRGS